jgi:hypothetical protein
MVRVEGLQKRSGGNVASLSCRISMVPTQEKNTPSLRNQCSSLEFSNQDPLKKCFGLPTSEIPNLQIVKFTNWI